MALKDNPRRRRFLAAAIFSGVAHQFCTMIFALRGRLSRWRLPDIVPRVVPSSRAISSTVSPLFHISMNRSTLVGSSAQKSEWWIVGLLW